LLAQLALGALQGLPPGSRQVLAGAIDVKGQHRQRRAVRIGFAPPAAFGRAFQRSRDLFRIAFGEDAAVEIERVALTRHPRRPAPSARGAPRRFAPRALSAGTPRRFPTRSPNHGTQSNRRNLQNNRWAHGLVPADPLHGYSAAMACVGSLRPARHFARASPSGSSKAAARALATPSTARRNGMASAKAGITTASTI